MPNADISEDELPFVASSSDDEFIILNRSPRFMSMSPIHAEVSSPPANLQLVGRSPSMHMPEFYYREIPFLDNPLDGPDVFMDTHGDTHTTQGTWREPQDFMNSNFYLEEGMLFKTKKELQRAFNLLHLKSAREYHVTKSTKTSWRICCKRADQGCGFKATNYKSKETNMWTIGTYHDEHTCNMGTCREGHFNLNVEMIASILLTDIEKTPRY